MKKLTAFLIITLLLAGCAATNVAVRPSSVNVQVGHSSPGEGYDQLGPITAKHGGGCGLYGAQGDFEGAMNILRNKADERGADYVQIISQQGEHMTGLCLDRSYVINGFAYKKSTQSAKVTKPNDGNSEVGLGSCFAVSPDGYLATNNHVIEEAELIYVRLANGETLPAKIVSSTASNDLAILKVDIENIRYLSISSSNDVSLGDEVFTIGYPLANVLGVDPKYTEGVISAKSGLGGEAIAYQITVPVQPGNSGGPLVNQQGEVVGVITSTASSIAFFKKSGNFPQNINWAVKSDYLKLLIESAPKRVIASTRSEAIDNTEKAICMVLTKR
jgi:S1-C subfamily serine protease